MKRRVFERILCLLLALTLLCGLGGSVLALDTGDGAAFGTEFQGSGRAAQMASWTNDALPLEELQTLLNSEPLRPQRTGWVELDAQLEQLIQASGAEDTYGKLLYVYDYLVKNVVYSWDGYSNTHASVASYNSFSDDYLSDMSYDGTTVKAVSDDMANRARHMLTRLNGVCYDYAITLAVAARYIGLESYVRTGIFNFEDSYMGSGHHGWTLILLGGKEYVFDSQRDARNYKNRGENLFYFGVPDNMAYRYHPDSSQGELEANAQRDETFLPMGAGQIPVEVQVSRSGQVQGTGFHAYDREITLTADPAEGFGGWYDSQGTLLSEEPAYTLTVLAPVSLVALYAADGFADITESDWFREDAVRAKDLGLVNGMTPVVFGGQEPFSRAMAAVMLCRLEKPAETAPAAPFTDLEAGRWYVSGVNWAYEAGIVKGMTADTFAPEDQVKRQDFFVMAARYLEFKGAALDRQETDFADREEISGYALEAVEKLTSAGLVRGDRAGTLRPQETLTRAEGTAMLVRLQDYLSAMSREKNP